MHHIHRGHLLKIKIGVICGIIKDAMCLMVFQTL